MAYVSMIRLQQNLDDDRSVDGRIWALREDVTAYDAAYVALAEGLRAPLVTRDRRLAAAPGITGPIELV